MPVPADIWRGKSPRETSRTRCSLSAASLASEVKKRPEKIENLRETEEVATHILKEEWNLLINQGKTEYVDIHLDKIEKTKPVKDKRKEKWRKTISLGSVLDPSKDIKRKVILAQTAFNKFQKMWMRKKNNIQKDIKTKQKDIKRQSRKIKNKVWNNKLRQRNIKSKQKDG